MHNSHTTPLRSLVSLAIPTALAHIANMMLQVVDTAFLGRYSSAALGGASVGNTFFVAIHLFILGPVLANDFFVARAFGKGDHEGTQVSFWTALSLSSGFSLVGQGILLLISTGPFSGVVLSFLKVEPSLHPYARDFISSVSWSLLPNTIGFLWRQYFQSKNRAQFTLLIFLATNLVNALGNYTLVFGNFGVPEMGVFGSGLSTTIARWFTVACFVVYTLNVEKSLLTRASTHIKKINLKMIKELYNLGIPISTSLLLEVGAFALSTILLSRLTVHDLAAHQIVLQIASLTFMLPLGIGAAVASKIGQAYGRGDIKRMQEYGTAAIKLTIGIMAGLAITIVLGNRFFLGLFTSESATIAVATQLLFVAGAFQIMDGLQVVAAGLLRGLGISRPTFIANLIGHWGLGLPVGAYLAFSDSTKLGPLGIWIGLSIGLFSVAILLLFAWKNSVSKLLKT